MCGIAAIFSNQDSGDGMTSMQDMLEQIHHRGPDETDAIAQSGVVLGHKRLSIMGPDNGIQPIANEDKSAWIICNGEIYNYRKLSTDYLQKHVFDRDSDSEIPLHLYEELGHAAARHLQGMFAFIIVDFRGPSPVAYAARDALGIKPLYYAETERGLIFASEMKCLYAVTDEVHEFPPGHYYATGIGFVAFQSAYGEAVHSVQPKQFSESVVSRRIGTLLERAVSDRMMSDVPLGVFLSGGLDSSLIAAIAAKKSAAPLKSFSIGLQGSNDVLAAREVANFLGTEHFEYIYTEDELWSVIPDVIFHLESFDPSLVRSAIPNYLVSRFASEHVKVILSGEGADELFGGYKYYQDYQTSSEVHGELLRTLSSMHNINLQRLDRMTMAHSLEGRVPFLDLELVAYALQIPPELKLRTDGQQVIEKWILRRAFAGLGVLPDSILWRTKEEFSEGSGAKDVLEDRIKTVVGTEEFNAWQAKVLADDGLTLRSPMELYFYRIFKDFFPHKSATQSIGRWAIA